MNKHIFSLLSHIIFASLALTTNGLTQNSSKNIFTLISNDITNNKQLPDFCTLKKGNQSPQLTWLNAPQKTKSFAIINDDPDGRNWSHWIIFNIPATVKHLNRGVVHEKPTLENNIFQGINDFHQIGYDGGWPPKGSGTHHYIFTIYALDTILNLPVGTTTKQQLLNAMNGHIITQASITTTYSRS